MKPLPWLTAQCVDLEINRRQLVEIQMSTHTHPEKTHTTHDASDKDRDRDNDEDDDDDEAEEDFNHGYWNSPVKRLAMALAFCENSFKLLIRRN